jgi:hypothetical protein
MLLQRHPEPLKWRFSTGTYFGKFENEVLNSKNV